MHKLIANLRHVDCEQKIITEFLQRYLKQGSRVLDVGCGFGRNLELGKRAGMKMFGVDRNPHSISENRIKGFVVYSVDELEKLPDERFDCLLMSHIIEHFAPADLISFLEKYIKRLSPGGLLYIATPFYSSYFFNDLDHVKLYQPHAFKQFFCSVNEQIFYQSPFQLELLDIQFPRAPLRLGEAYRGKYLRTWDRYIVFLFETLLAGIYWLSCGWIGRKDRWLGIFRLV